MRLENHFSEQSFKSNECLSPQEAKPFRSLVRRAVLGVALAAAASAANSQAANWPKWESHDQLFQAAAQAGPAKSIVFQLRQVAVPLCGSRARWDWIQELVPVTERTRGESAATARMAKVLGERFGAQPGELVVLAPQLGSYRVQGGLQTGDRIVLERVEDLALHARERLGDEFYADQQARLQQASDWARSYPVQQLKLIRQGEVLPLQIEHVPTCPVGLSVINSASSYAASLNGTILLTKPMLDRVSGMSLKMVLAHELAQVLLGFSDSSKRDDARAGFMSAFGNNSRWNRELGIGAPSTSVLIKADQLTVLLLEALSVGTQDYLDYLLKLQAIEPGGLSSPAHVNVRPVPAERIEALRALHAKQQSEGNLPKPEWMEDQLFRELQQSVAAARRRSTGE